MKLLLVVGCLLLSFFSNSTLAAENNDSSGGIIRGAIVNETPGGGSVENQEVTLHVGKDGSELESLTVTSNSSGNFEFSNLATEESYTYYLSLDYQGAEYTGDTVSFEENQTLLAVNLVVYDSTSNNEKIRMAIDHVIIEKAEKGTLLVSETLVFHNTGEKTYIGQKNELSGKQETVRIPLPRDFHDLEYMEGLMGCCVSQTKDGVVDTMDLKPGLKKAVLRYRLNYTAKSYSSPKSFPYTTTAFYVLAPAVFQLFGEGLSRQGPLELGGREYMALGGEEIPAGSTVTFGISGLPFGWGRYARLAVIGLILAFVAIAVSFSVSRKGKQLRAQETARKIESVPETEEYLRARKKTLLSLIAHLDDEFQAEEIPEHIYKEMRQEFKERLAKIMEELGG